MNRQVKLLGRLLLVSSLAGGFLPLTAGHASAATITVNSINDPGTGTCDTAECTLREAIAAAEAAPGTDNIGFNIAGSGPHVIALASGLAPIDNPVIIDATTEPDYAGTPVVVLDGTNSGGPTVSPGGSVADYIGLWIRGGGSTVAGLVINDFNLAGIRLESGDGNTVRGNYIGTNPDGTAAGPGNTEGVLVFSAGNTIGGTTSADMNVISGNSTTGVRLEFANSNDVFGNRIGTNAAGTAPVANSGVGVWVASNTADNDIGGSASGAGNLISGNGDAGVLVSGVGISGSTIAGNRIGTNAAGTAAVANGGDGIEVIWPPSSDLNPISNTTIGGSTPGAGNLISGNAGSGVNVEGDPTLVDRFSGVTIQGNIIGLSADGESVIGNDGDGVLAYNISGELLLGGSTSATRNVISGNSGYGAQLLGFSATFNVTGNYIGTDDDGTTARGNGSGGALIEGEDSTVGGTTGTSPGGDCTGQCNLISSNAGHALTVAGLTSTGSDILVRGNYIGTDVAGTADLGNTGAGVVQGTTNVVIGGTSATSRNVVGGNDGHGMVLGGQNVRVWGNYIGLGADAATDLGNGGHGIRITGRNNEIGGTETGQGNIIAFNDWDGVGIFVTLSATEDRNAILGNSVYDNGQLGIDLEEDGVTQNDTGDVDGGANDEQNYPVIDSAVTNTSDSTVTGSVSTNASSSETVRIELFSNSVCDDSTYGEGETLLDSFTVTTDPSGSASFSRAVGSLTVGEVLTATATDQDGNTSEFSACEEILPSISVNDVSVAEGNTGITSATFTLTLSATSPEVVTVDYLTANGSATSPADFTGENGTVTFVPGDTTEDIAVDVHGDTVDEPNETFLLNLSNVQNAALPDTQATGTITDDDAAPPGSTPSPSPTPTPTPTPTGTITGDDAAPPASTSTPTATCKGKRATIVGTSADDTLAGTRAADVIAGLGGNDTIAGLGGNDLVCAGDGNDRVGGGPGNDKVLGEAGNDKLKGSGGNDKLIGGSGKDAAAGGSGKDKAPGAEKHKGIP